jgi:serine/threonine protein kinase/tetratricopeptide (TPR) repeat protein
MTVRLIDEQAIFEAARNAGSPELRQALLDERCGEDDDLKRRVVALLRAAEENDSFLESPAFEDQQTAPIRPIAEGPGTVIGLYKLLQQIGEGGMGVVFMAEQSQPIQRTVALKIIKPGMDTRQVIARFEAERQAVAMMDHPNIAKVLDAGTTDSGRPYFVMELVKGVPITKYCDEKHLSLRARLELFIQVCQAVQHAHQKGIIHRDIKPTNVLVAEYDNHAVPKVIDFGVAKATAQRLTERTMFTEFGQVLGTMEYMSPEQSKFNQLDIDTRSDIYSLGVLLYELLAGSTPFEGKRLHAAAFDEMLRIIREEEPPKPSTRLTASDTLASIAANRHIDPARLSKDVRGELDWIVMKALEKDRNRRYETASGFAADIERHLHDEPVQAGPPSAAYRLRKFARRNRVAFSTAALVLVALVAGTIVSTWQAIRATRAEALAQTRLQAESDARKQANDAFKQANTNYELAEEQRKAAEAQRRRAQENVKLAASVLDKILIKPAAQRLSADREKHERLLPRDAKREQHELDVLQDGAEFYEQLAKGNSTDPSAQLEAAKAYRTLAYLQMCRGQNDKCAALFQNAIDILEQLMARSPDVAEYGLELAYTYRYLAWPYRDNGELDRAVQLTRRSVLLLEKLRDQFPADLRRCQSELLWSYKDLGLALSLAGRIGEAERAYRDSLAISDALPSAAPQDETDRWNLIQKVETRGYLGDILKRAGRTPEAIHVWQESLPLWEKLIAAGNERSHRRDLAIRLDALGDALAECDRIREAQECYSKALMVWQKLAGDFNLPADRRDLALNRERLARMLQSSGRLAEAEQAYQQALPVWEKLVGDFQLLDDRAHLSRSYSALVDLLDRLAQGAEANDRLQPAEQKTASKVYSDKIKEIENKAVPLLSEFLADQRKQLAPNDTGLAAVLAHIGRDFLKYKQYAEATKVLRECLLIRERKEADVWTTFNTRSMLGGALLGEKKFTEAEPLLLSGYEGMREREPTIPAVGRVRLIEALDRLVQLYDATGQNEKTAEWRSKLDARRDAENNPEKSKKK